MSFSNPSYLWALWGLLLPLAIHLWSKREARTLKIGSVELLEESHSRQSSSIQMNEWPLLLLRMAIVALAVLLMAGPRWRAQGKADPVAYLVEPSLAGHPGLVQLLDSLAVGAEVLLLQQGFPPWEPGMGPLPPGTPAYWQLVQKMDSLPPDSLVVFARAHQRGIKGKRPGTHKKIHWVILGEGEEVETPLMAQEGPWGLASISLLSNGQGTRFKKQPLPEDPSKTAEGDSLELQLGDSLWMLPLVTLDPLKIHMYVQPGLDPGLPYLEAALSALSRYLERKIDIQRYGPGERAQKAGDLNLWLRELPLDGPGGTWLVFKENRMARALIEQKGDSLYHLTGELDTKNTVEGHLVRQLLPLMATDPLPVEKAKGSDLGQMDTKQFQARYEPPKTKRDLAHVWELSPWTMLALALLLALERLISKSRKQ